MKKTDWQYLVNTLLFVCIVGIIIIGIFMGLFLPKGPSALESSKYFLNLHRHQWGNIHFYLSIAFTALLIIHLTLDWKWIKARANKIFNTGWKTALIATAGVSILLLFVIWLFYPKEPGAYEDYGIGRGRNETVQIADDQEYLTVTGQMTLQDLEKATNIPAHKIIEVLELPAKVSQKETIGRLSKKYGISLVETRDVLTKLLNEETDAQNRISSAQDYQDMIPEKERKSEADVPDIQANHDKTEGEHKEEEKMTRGRLAEDQSSILITGQMSFHDIQRQTGIPARQIMSKLGLPANISANENIGRLRRRYSFTLQEVRDIVESSIKKK